MNSKAGIEIRSMLREDLEEVLAVERISFPTPWSRALFEKELLFPYAHPLVAAETTPPYPVQGYLCFWLVAEETHILNLAVHPKSRRRGVGSRLLAHAIDYSRNEGVEEILLEVRRSNRQAISLYRHFHFQPLGIRPRYYRDSGEDAIVMGLRMVSPASAVVPQNLYERNPSENR